MTLLPLFVLLAALSLVQALIPQLNIALSTPVLNQQIANTLGPKIVDKILNTTLNQTFSESMVYNLVKVDINMTKINFTQLDINWKRNTLVPKSDYTFRVNIKDINATLEAFVEGHVSLKKMNTNLTIIISNINGYIDFKISAPKSSHGVGFTLSISYIEIQIDDIDIRFKKDPIDTFVAQTVVSLIRKSLPHIINSLVQNQINPMLQNICNSRTFITAEIGNHLYQINLNTTQVPRFINLTYMAIPLDVMIINVDTGKTNQEIDNQHLPLKPFNQEDTVQITMSSGMVNTLLWLVQDSNLLDIYIDNSQLDESAPLNLNTSDLTILLPELSRQYGKGHGVYIHITLSTKTPNLYIRGGRLLTSIAVNLQFIVDLNDSLYPRNASECLASGQCVSAVTLNTSLVASAAFRVNKENRLYATIQTAKIVETKPQAGSKIGVDEAGLKMILNTLVPSMILPVNQQLKEGVDVPMGPIYGYNITNLMVKTELDYLAAALKFEFETV